VKIASLKPSTKSAIVPESPKIKPTPLIYSFSKDLEVDSGDGTLVRGLNYMFCNANIDQLMTEEEAFQDTINKEELDLIPVPEITTPELDLLLANHAEYYLETSESIPTSNETVDIEPLAI
jgi:hypothetical protein